jgi:hypothetical protein
MEAPMAHFRITYTDGYSFNAYNCADMDEAIRTAKKSRFLDILRVVEIPAPDTGLAPSNRTGLSGCGDHSF